ncbi:MAG: bacterioferritin [Gammaproteobacteria bacterium]|nr:bacterioferritin [Gammaproteobacteria bacterium]
MTADLRIISYLNRALTHELVAVQQYLAQAKLTALWGMTQASERLREDVAAELSHASLLMEELLVRGVAPASAALTPTRLADDLPGLLRHDRLLEVEAVRLYEEAARYCARARDERCRALFVKILDDEVEHIHELDEWIRTQHAERDHA